MDTADPLVNCARGQSVLGILCVSKGGLFLSFVAPNSDSPFWLGAGSCSHTNMVCSRSVMAFVPLKGPPFYLWCHFSLWQYNELWGLSPVSFSTILNWYGFNKSLLFTSVNTAGFSCHKLFLFVCARRWGLWWENDLGAYWPVTSAPTSSPPVGDFP